MSDPTPDPAAADDSMDGPLGAGLNLADPNSPLAPLYASVTGILAVLLVGAAFALYSLLPMMHTDVWTHLAHGRWIVEHRQLPQHEPLSPFTDQTAPLYHQCWLSQVLYHGVYSWGQSLGGDDRVKRFAGGGEMVRELHVFAAAGMLAALWVAFRRNADSGAIALVGVGLVVVAGVVGLGLFRPQIFGQLLFAVFLALLSRPLPSKAAVVAIPLLFAVWVNLHGSFAVGFVLLGLTWIGRVIEAWWAKAVVKDTALRRLTLAIVLGLVAACVNPAGPGVYLNVLGFGGNANLKTLQEWQPITAGVNVPSLVVYGGLWAVVLVCQLLSRRWVRPVHYLVLAVFGLAPLLQQRMVTWWLLASVWVMMPLMAGVAERFNWRLPRSVPSLRKTILAVLAAVPFLMLSPLFGWVTGGNPPDPNRVFVAATPRELAGALAAPTAKHDRMQPLADVLKEDYAGRPLGPVFCSPEVGEFLLWRNIDGAPPIRFTHAHLFPEEHWSACERAGRADGWEETFDRLGVNVVAVEPNFHAPLVEVMSKHPGWRVVLNEQSGRDPRARLFVAVRKESK